MITELPPTIPASEVHRLLGYPPDRAVPKRVESQLDALCTEALSLLRPRGTCERFALSDAAFVQLPLPGAPSALSGFALGLVTIGPRLEERTAAALNAGHASETLLLDAIGSAAVEAAADSLGGLLARTGRGNPGGYARPVLDLATQPAPLPCRISPGYGGWPLVAQSAIFARLPHDSLGVRLLPSMLMVPQKSVTFALWFDPAGRVIAGRGGCSRCDLEQCPRRASPQRGISA